MKTLADDKFQEPPQIRDRAKWFCVMTNPGCQARAALGLYAAGYRTFMPKVRKWATHARVRKAVEKPLLGRYLFVEVDNRDDEQSFGEVRGVNGVEVILSGVSGFGDGRKFGPLPFPSHWVEDLRYRYMAGEWDEIAKGHLPLGARIRVVEGEFNDMLATVTNRKGSRITFKIMETNNYQTMHECSVRAA